METLVPEWSDAAKTCLDRRILAKDPETGETIETADQMLQRVAWNVAQAELLYPGADLMERTAERFYEMMAGRRFFPNSPCLVNAGRPLQQLAACFVLPVGDSIEEIFDAVKLAAKIHQSGGGTGFSFGQLRPRGSRVKSTGNVASGPVTFMKVFDTATAAIKQGGVRRGANMGVLPIDHPDIREFIHLKNDNESLSNFNISVAVTDQFMRHLEHDTPFPLQWKGQIYDSVRPAELWDEITQSAWTSGDPGLLFIDRINQDNPLAHLGRIEATNPCGEVPLLPYHTCNLGSIDVSKYVTDESFDYDKLEEDVGFAVRFLDNVIDMNRYPHPLVAQETRRARKIGLGIMGWADLLIRLRISYGSREAHELAGELMGFIQGAADQESFGLGGERGAYPACLPEQAQYRNATRTVIAPTGTLSILANCSSGIEPLFGLTFAKNVMDTQVVHVSEAAKELLQDAGVWNPETERKLLAGYPAMGIPEISPRVADILRTAHEIPVDQHVKTQAAFQQYVDDSISKTINFSSNATPTNISDTYYKAYKLDCKGITVYRDGCKTGGQVLQFRSTSEEVCPDCGGKMIHAEGCNECSVCGLSLCAA